MRAKLLGVSSRGRGFAWTNGRDDARPTLEISNTYLRDTAGRLLTKQVSPTAGRLHYAMTQKNLGLPELPAECSKSVGRSKSPSASGMGEARVMPQGPSLSTAETTAVMSREKNSSMMTARSVGVVEQCEIARLAQDVHLSGAGGLNRLEHSGEDEADRAIRAAAWSCLA